MAFAGGGFVVHEFFTVPGGNAIFGSDVEVVVFCAAGVDGAFRVGAAGLGVWGDVFWVFVIEGFVVGVVFLLLVRGVEVGDGEAYSDAGKMLEGESRDQGGRCLLFVTEFPCEDDFFVSWCVMELVMFSFCLHIRASG